MNIDFSYIIDFTLVVFLLVEFINALSNKLRIDIALQNFALKCSFKPIFKLLNCNFCKNFHLSLLITLSISLLIGLEFQQILVPFCVAGLYKIIT